MKVTKNQIDDLNAVITVAVEKADYQTKVDAVLKDYRKNAKLDGFRPGKAPMGIIKKMYGTSVVVDEVNKVISNGLNDFITSEDLQILGEPMPNDDQEPIDFDKADDFSFKFDVGLTPEIEISLTKRDKLNYYKVLADDEMIDEYVASYAKNYGETKDTETSTEDSYLIGKILQLDAEEKPFDGGVVNEAGKLAVSLAKDDDEEAKLIGVKVGDIITVDLWKTFPNEAEIAGILNIKKEEVEILKEAKFQMTVAEVKTFFEAEVNQELFDKVFGEGEVKSIEEFRTRLKVQAEESYIPNSEYKLLLDAKAKLIKKVDPKLPEEFLKVWIKAVNKEITEEQLEKEWPLFLDDMKWQIISNKLAKENELKLESDELLVAAKEFAAAQFRQYGMSSVPDEYAENYAKELLSNEEQRRKIIDTQMEKKVLNVIREKIKIEDKEVSMDDFKALFED